MHAHVMTDTDQEKAHALKNEILDLCLHRKVNTLVALSAVRCAAECFESIINEQQGEVFTVDATTSPETPVVARELVEEIAALCEHESHCASNERYPSPECDCGLNEKIAAIITRYFAATPLPVAETPEACTNCGGSGEIEIGCAMDHALTAPCVECGGTGHVAKAVAPVVADGDNEGEIETRAGHLPLSLLNEIQERRETIYKGFGYEHYAPQMKTDLDHALAIAAALRTHVEGEK